MQEYEVSAVVYGEYKGRTVTGYIRYFLAKLSEKEQEKSYKCYVTDILKCLAERNKVEVDYRWIELIEGKTNENEAETAINNFYSDLRGGD